MSDCKSSWERNEAPTESMRSHLTGCPHSSLDPTGGLVMWLLGFIKFRETSRHIILASTLQNFRMIDGSLRERHANTHSKDCDQEKLRCFKQVLEALKTGKRQVFAPKLPGTALGLLPRR